MKQGMVKRCRESFVRVYEKTGVNDSSRNSSPASRQLRFQALLATERSS
jgi:hypothetical protein